MLQDTEALLRYLEPNDLTAHAFIGLKTWKSVQQTVPRQFFSKTTRVNNVKKRHLVFRCSANDFLVIDMCHFQLSYAFPNFLNVESDRETINL